MSGPAEQLGGTLGGTGLAALLPYQQRALTAIAQDQVLVVEKSRRIGLTWAVAADSALTAAATRKAGGSDVFYVGYNLDMAREYIDACAMWAKAFGRAAKDVEEHMFLEETETGETRSIKAYRIAFASGFEVVALCSAPRSLRGKQGKVIIDEAAFHAELAELLKSALALLMWGGKVVVISTHDGVDNPFNALLEECRAGRRPYGLLRITLTDAIADGLYRRICLVKGTAWSREGEAKWEREVRDFYGEDAAEELDCIPKRSGGKYFASHVLRARARPTPVLRWTCPDEFALRSDEERSRVCAAWLEEHVAPVLASIGEDANASFVGEDFARSGDLSVDWPLVLYPDNIVRTPFVIELRNVPFLQQEQVFVYLTERLPGFRGAALDRTGNGAFLAERAEQRWGSACEGIALSEGWYREHAPPLKAALEAAEVELPDDVDLVDDLRSVEVVRGVARVPEKPRRTKGGQRHGDGAIALMLAWYARRQLDHGPIDVGTTTPNETTRGLAGPSRFGLSTSKASGWDL